MSRTLPRAATRGGWLIGESHPKAKLTDGECELVRELRAEGFNYRWLAAKFDCSISTVSNILNRKIRSATVERCLPPLPGKR